MAKGIGKLLQIGIAKETVRGTAETAATYWLQTDDFNVMEKDERVTNEQTLGVIEASQGEDIIRQWAEVTYKAPIGDKHFALILNGILGTLTTGDNADSDASIKDHVVTVAQSAQHQAITLFKNDPLATADYKHALGCIESLEISYEQGKYLEYTATLKAKKGAGATLTVSNTVENRFLPQHVVFKMASAQSGLGAASATVIKSLKLKIESNLEPDWVLGSVAPADFLNKQLAISGELEAIWDSEATLKTPTLAGTKKALRLDMINTDVTIGSAANPMVRIDLHKVVFADHSTPAKLHDIMLESIAFTAHYDVTDSKMITATVTNAVASY